MQDFTELIEDKPGVMKSFLKMLGFNPKKHYTFEALRELEGVINDGFPEGHDPKPTTLIPFGWYLLKTLEKNISGAKIITKVETVWNIRMEFKKKDAVTMTLFPFRRVDKFWIDREDSMAAMLEMTVFLKENDPSLPEIQMLADEDGWIKLPHGSVFRMHVATKEQAKEILKHENPGENGR